MLLKILYHKITNLSTGFLWFCARKVSLFTISSYFPREAGAKVPNGSIGDFAGGIRYDVQVVLSTFHEMIFSKEKARHGTKQRRPKEAVSDPVSCFWMGLSRAPRDQPFFLGG